MEILERLKQEGLRIILVDNLPENFDAAVKDGYEVSPLQELPKHLDDVRELKLAQPFRELVYYHYEKRRQRLLAVLQREHLRSSRYDGVYPVLSG